MLVIKLWCLPANLDEDQLREIHIAVVSAVVSIGEIGIKDESDMCVLFPPDMMKYGLGSEIIAEITGLIERPEGTLGLKRTLAWKVGAVLTRFFPRAKIQSYVQAFNPLMDASWSSNA